jgi:tRNA threonylcarbamoyladenosine modification (KEOPS) complex Cgi121 subunit
MADTDSESEAHPIAAWSREVAQGEGQKVMDSMLLKASATGARILVLDGSMVFGSDHLASALYHARKAVLEGRNASDSLQMETLLYSSGERQLSSAIRKMSVSGASVVVVVARLSEDEFEPGDGWTALPRRPESVDVDSLRRYGINPSEAGTTPEYLLSDLVLERVANVDLMKK